jgi:ABC-2 type transport system permease protein
VGGRRLVWKAEPDARLSAVVRAALHRVRFAQQAARLGLSPAQAAALARPPAVPERRLEAGDRDAREAIAMASFLVLLTMVLWYGASVADGVAQEKGTRVMELLLCRVRPRDLLAGKVLGIGAVGLAQMLLALVAALVAIVAADTVEVPQAVPATLVAAVVWFTLGYAFFSVAFAAVGALASRVEDLGPALAPLTWLVMLSAFAAPFAAENPDAWYVQLASLFPTSAPFVMPVRVAIDDVPLWETTAAVAILLGAGYGLVRIGAAVYAGSVLRTGPRPRLRDVWQGLVGSSPELILP